MDITAKLTFLFGNPDTTLEITDEKSGITFVRAKINPEQLARILSREGYVTVESCKVFNLQSVGKRQETKTFTFKTTHNGYPRDVNALDTECRAAMGAAGLSDWQSDNYYNSQNSFYMDGEKQYARVTIRRWVENGGEER